MLPLFVTNNSVESVIGISPVTLDDFIRYEGLVHSDYYGLIVVKTSEVLRIINKYTYTIEGVSVDEDGYDNILYSQQNI